MRVFNKSRSTVVSEDAELADSFLSRLRGLMFRRNPKTLLFVFPESSVKRNSIHAFFVFFEFDAIYLDSGKRVVNVHERVKPFTPYLEPAAPAKYLVEMAGGSASKRGIKAGDVLEF